ncbi:CbtA family protein [Streptomyces afghaniensis]|uniref:CbtA family protein n=1 Tax=Streptomyces afghaniensis TaxID=66865 RepID=UPI002782BDA2|nr:CbtA family protein [Streptomyces afghaniensis]MDQ1014186.1 phosphate/sulfate permease [Streptomyces afghaniensis]
MNSTTVRTLLVRGMLAGLAAGVLAFVFAYVVGEGSVDAAIAFEESKSHEHGEELVSRSLQSTAGLATGVLVFGVAIGGIAALAFCFALGRIGRFGARATAALTALAGFLLVYLVPILKYPANPPAVGDPDTIAKRTALFVLMIALSVLLGIGAVLLGRRLAPGWGNWNASITAGVAFVAAVGVAMAILPHGDNIPKGFPAADLWEFRLASIGIQAVLWSAFGLLFGYLAERALEPQPVRGRVSTLTA